jgi:hypothetical protein
MYSVRISFAPPAACEPNLTRRGSKFKQIVSAACLTLNGVLAQGDAHIELAG